MIKKILPLIYIKDIERLKKSQKVILCLESKFFNIFKIELDNVLNAEDRIEKIEDRLEIIFSQYTLNEYILEYEILETKKKKETLIVYLLNISKLEKSIIIDDIQKYKILSLFPAFLKCREYKKNENFYNFDIDSEVMIISKYTAEKIENIEIFSLGKQSIENLYNINFDNDKVSDSTISIIDTYLENIEENYDVIFTGKNIRLEDLYTEKKNISFFNIGNLEYKKYLNFLPKDIKKKYYFYYVNEFYLLTILVLTIILFISTFFINYKIRKKEEYIINLQYNSSNLEENIFNMRKEMEEIEENMKTLKEKLEKVEYIDFKVSSLLYDISALSPSEISIESIEYDDKKVLNIIGKAKSEISIIKFIENISSAKNFKMLNWDYILKNKDFFEFKVEVKYFLNKRLLPI